MKDRYFSTYQSIKYKQCFYRAHYANAYKKNLAYSITLVLISLASATVWGVSKSQPVAWAFIIGAAQLAQAFVPLLPWSEQLAALKFFMPEAVSLIARIDADWLDINLKEYTDEQIKSLIISYDQEFFNLESKFIGTTYFPEKKKIVKAAKIEQFSYFNVRYPNKDTKEKEVNCNAE